MISIRTQLRNLQISATKSVIQALGRKPRFSNASLRDSLGLVEEPQRELRKLVNSSEPKFLGRFGRTELCLTLWEERRRVENTGVAYLEILNIGEHPLFFKEKVRRIEKSGIYPFKEWGSKFAQRMKADAGNLDALASWLQGEASLVPSTTNPIVVSPVDLESFWYPDPWTSVLKGKRVLVVHPFYKTIESQYEKRRSFLFENSEVLPDFDLITLPPPRAYFGEIVSGDIWFEKFWSLMERINQLSFDVALVGAGPMGFAIASEIKNQGKKAIHIGGALQLLFGIKGRRWESRDAYRAIFNEYWVRPLPEETPGIQNQPDEGAYW